jgi:hypothetical protein
MRPIWAVLLGALFVAACAPASDHAPDPQGCAVCHMAEFRGVKDPVHVGQRPTTCGVCHSQDSWHPSVLEHPFWALTGAHAKESCFGCHTGDPPKFKGTSKVCVGCHRKDYNRAPNHVAQKFPTKCEGCHQTNEWSDRIGSPAPQPSATPHK